jgi:glycosyltransferase involved in cell wall biosynthesis
MRRRTLLVFAYLFPPEMGVGAIRPAGLVKYLPECDWEAIVVAGGTIPGTEMADGYAVIRLPTNSRVRELKRSLRIGGHVLPELTPEGPATFNARVGTVARRAASEVAALYPDSLPWLPRAYRVALDILRTRAVDAILSTSKPEVTHLAATFFARRFRLPWIADLRDPWSTNYAYSYSRIRRVGERRLERMVLAPASQLTTVSDGMTPRLREIHGDKPITVIENGFDSDLLAPDDVNLDAKLSLVYTGRLYRQQRLDLVFEALRRLVDSGRIDPLRVEVRIYGQTSSSVETLSTRFGLTALVRQAGMVPRTVAIDAQRVAQILLLPRWEDASAPGVLGGKVFEYLAARRPILAPGSHRDAAEALLDSTGAGCATHTVAETEAFLGSAYDEFVRRGRVSYSARLEELERFSHRVMAQRFVAELDPLVEKCTPGRRSR